MIDPTIRELLYELDNVVGMGTGPKYRQERIDEDVGRSVQVHVSRKARTPSEHRSLQADDQLVPDQIEDYETDVIEAGYPVETRGFNVYVDPYPNRRKRFDPIPSGVAVSNGMGTGTLSGPFVADDGAIVMWSNEHVGRLHDDDDAPYYHPNPWAEDRVKVGPTRRKSTPSTSHPNRVDFREIYADDPDDLTAHALGLGNLGGFDILDESDEGMMNAKSGMRSTITEAELRSTDASVRVEAAGMGTLEYENVHFMGPQALAGDSGSLTGYVNDGEFIITGLLFAGSTRGTWAIPIESIFDEFGEFTIYDTGLPPDEPENVNRDSSWPDPEPADDSTPEQTGSTSWRTQLSAALRGLFR